MNGAVLLVRLAEAPSRAAIFLDMDGVLAPIVPRPEDAVVPAQTRAELVRLVSRYALVACVSGRVGADVAERIGVEGVAIAGEHGLELEPAAEAWRGRIASFVESAGWPAEAKRLSAAFHYRGAPDEGAARARLEELAARARELGFRARFGRKVLEVLPPVEADKGTAVRRLLERAGLARALYAGDDTTDLDGFRALDGLELAVRVAVASDEGPPGLRAAADVVVESPAALAELLRRL